MAKWSKLNEIDGTMYREIVGTTNATTTPTGTTAFTVTLTELTTAGIKHIDISQDASKANHWARLNSIGTTTTTTACGSTGVTVPTFKVAVNKLTNTGATKPLSTATAATLTVMYRVLGVAN